MKREIREKALSILMFVIVLFYTNLTMSGTWTTIDFPGAMQTIAWGIDGDNIVGNYFDLGNLSNRGFLYDGTNWITLDYPLAVFAFFLI
ncbi:MAG: hypothetical protein ACYTEE_06150 [Planctomycetota bacterium]|jgi:hypothetical protein